MCPTNVWW